MRYITLILKNPFRNKTRTALSVLGIAIGIATIVALGLITDGLDESIQTTLNSGGAEITVTGAIDSEANTKDINTSYLDTLANISGVNETAGLLRIQEINLKEMMNGERTSITAYGIDKDKLDLVGIEDVNGSLFEENSSEAIMGKSFAETRNKTIGDTITIQGHEFKIVGEFETGSLLSDNSLYVSKEKLQEITGKDHLTQILIKTNENVNDTKIADEIEDKYGEDLLTFTTEEQVQMMSQITSILDLVTYAISALAIIIGGIGIINTMIMAVYERTKEIGVLRAVGWKSRRILMMIIGETLVLRAVGWKSRRILMMIIGETLVLTTLSAIVGIIGGITISEIGIRLIGNANNAFALAYHPETFITAFAVAIIVGVLGGIYPAYKASKLAPTEALRYE